MKFVLFLSIYLNLSAVFAAVTLTGPSGSCYTYSQQLSVTWSNPSPKGTDWLGIYPVASCNATTCPSGSWGWSYICGGHTACTGKIGPQTVTITNTAGPTGSATFAVYYLANGGYTINAKSSDFTIADTCSGGSGGFKLVPSSTTIPVSGLLNFSWSGGVTTSADDWITYWAVGSSPTKDHNYVHHSWRYTYGGLSTYVPASASASTVTGTIAIQAPPTSGIYTVYYCQNDGYTCPISTTVNVTAASVPTVQCSLAGLSNIKHLVLIEKENHSWDSVFGKYCTAAPGSNPTKNYGPSSCEAAPSTVSGVSAVTLTDAQNLKFDPPHDHDSMTCFVDGGKMDKYTGGCSNSNANTFAIMDTTATGHAAVYGQIAASNISKSGKMNSALADHFFQAAIGASSENDMYYAIPQFMFRDNEQVPQNSSLNGARCYSANFVTYTAPTIYDLLTQCGVSWAMYAQGWNANPTSTQCYAEGYFDASDFGESYFSSLTTNPGLNWKDSIQFQADVLAGVLPAVSHVRATSNASEHPGDSSISASTNFITTIINAIDANSTYNQNTLILIVDDESGSYYDHISPPGLSAIDGQFYGPRLDFSAIGYHVQPPNGPSNGYISHVPMEPASIIKFIEWNWLNGKTGQLLGRDMVCANLGSLLDSTRTGVTVPSF